MITIFFLFFPFKVTIMIGSLLHEVHCRFGSAAVAHHCLCVTAALSALMHQLIQQQL